MKRYKSHVKYGRKTIENWQFMEEDIHGYKTFLLNNQSFAILNGKILDKIIS